MRRRIIICLGVLLALCVAGDAIALWCLNRSIAQLSALVECHRIQVMRADLAFAAVRVEFDSMADLAGQPRNAPSRRDTLVRFEDSLERCARCHHAAEIQRELDKVRATFDSYVTAVDRVLTAGRGADLPTLEREANLVADELTGQATDMADKAYDHVSVRSVDVEAGVRHAWMTLCGTLAVALVVGVFVAWHLQHRLTRPVDDLLQGINLMRAGNPGHRLAINADAEFRTLGEAFNEAHERMATAQRGVLQAEKMAAVGKLAAGIAHEVGNPLASISSVAQMMRRNVSDPQQADRIDMIMQNVGRVSQVVRELLTFSRPSRDDGQGRVDLSKLLDNAISLLRYDKRAGRANIESRYEPGLAMERGNPGRLLLVFTNIILNAFDALSIQRNGDGRVIIAADCLDDRIVIRFEDNGPGMTREQLESAFEPFFTTKDPGSGTGLGLWICYQVVQKHDGTIRIDSAPGSGTTITIELPATARAATTTCSALAAD